MKRKTLRIVFMLLALVFVGMQFIPVNRQPLVQLAENDFAAQENLNPEALKLLKAACYDCHSNTTDYPWYSYIAPISFIVNDHIEEGKEELNFSAWAGYSAPKKAHKLEECSEALREGWMPLKEYVALHKSAKLTVQQREMLALDLDRVAKRYAKSNLQRQAHEVEHVHTSHQD